MRKTLIPVFIGVFLLSACDSSSEPQTDTNPPVTHTPKCIEIENEDSCAKLTATYYIDDVETKTTKAKQQIKDLIDQETTDKLHAVIYPKEIVNLEKLEEYITNYDLLIASKLNFLDEETKDKVTSVSLITGKDKFLATYLFKEFNAAEAKEDITDPENPKLYKEPIVNAFNVWATPAELLRFWEENEEIGLICDGDMFGEEEGDGQSLFECN